MNKSVLMALIAVIFCAGMVSCSKETEIKEEEQLPPILSWDAEDNYNLTKEEGSVYVSFETNYDWKITIEYIRGVKDWLTLSVSEGSAGMSSFGVHATENESYEVRLATVTFICKDEKKLLTIFQEPSPKPETIKLEAAGWLSRKLTTIRPNVEQLTIEGYMNGDDIQALREFYSFEYAMERLDLSNVNIVKGGSFEFKQDLGFSGSEWRKQTCDKDNVIPANMFNNGFRGLEVLILPKSATEIGNYALAECVSLLEVQLPANVITIGNNAFRNCTDVKAIDLPETVTSIGGAAFWQCNQLVSIDIPEGVTKIAPSTFGQCRNLKRINLPESLTEIEPMAFTECSWGLTQLTIPKNVKKVGYQAFYKCTKLETIICLAEKAPEIKHVFTDGTVIYPFDEGVMINLAVPKFCSSSYRLSDWRLFCWINELNY